MYYPKIAQLVIDFQGLPKQARSLLAVRTLVRIQGSHHEIRNKQIDPLYVPRPLRDPPSAQSKIAFSATHREVLISLTKALWGFWLIQPFILAICLFPPVYL